MVFSSIVFLWIFLPVVFIGTVVLHKWGNIRLANLFLLLSSLFFYAWGGPKHIVLLLLSICMNWAFGLAVAAAEERNSLRGKQLVLFLCVCVNLALLGYFKYAAMLLRTVGGMLGVALPVPQVTLPIGISFFTFQAMSYVIDVYRKDTPAQKNLLKLGLYISLFPQLIAGPIVKYKDVCEQIDDRHLSLEKTADGIRRFVYGLGKKVLISNVLAATVDQIYGLGIGAVTSLFVWVASLFYMMQIYYDFSGYSDMAIGLGKMFGFEFKENFNYPYTARSIQEFWRRWHISLSSWFREYLYIPLGGSRKGTRLTYENLLIVFFLTGLWHGASWNFVVWGLFHGFFLLVERMGLKRFLEKHKLLALGYALFVVNIGWVFFRIENIAAALAYIKRLLLPWMYLSSTYSVWEFCSPYTWIIFACAVIGMGPLQRIFARSKIGKNWSGSGVEILACTGILLLCIMSLASNTYNPFIYFRF